MLVDKKKLWMAERKIKKRNILFSQNFGLKSEKI